MSVGLICKATLNHIMSCISNVNAHAQNGHNSTYFRSKFDPYFKIPIGYFLFDYAFWWHFCQDLCTL